PKAVFGTAADVVRDTISSTVNIGPGIGGSKTDPVETFVDAKNAITGNGTNEVGVTHTFTVTGQQNLGDGAGYVAARQGHVVATLTGSNGITAADITIDPSSTCDTTGSGSGNNLSAGGTCTVVFSSSKAGQVNGDATVTIPKAVFGTAADVVRDTISSTVNIGPGIGGSNTDPVKTFVDANIAMTGNGTNEVGVTHTFTVTVQQNLGDGAGYVAAPTFPARRSSALSNGITAADITID